jgi:hypothetical protein
MISVAPVNCPVATCIGGKLRNRRPQNPANARVLASRQEECSFLKKRTKRLLRLRWRTLSGHGRERGTGGED